MIDDNKAPGWSVLEAGPKVHGVIDGSRLVCWTESGKDADRIVEAVNGLAEAQRERNDLRAELAALRGAADTVWRVDSVTTPDGVELWSVYDGDRLVMAAQDEAQARLVAAAPGCLRVADEAKAKVDRLNAALAALSLTSAAATAAQAMQAGDALRSFHAPTPASTLAALTQAAERLNATLARHEELLGVAAPKPDDDEITKLRAVALAVADWLDAEADTPSDEPSYDSWDRLGDAVAVAVFGDRDRWEEAPTTLRALAGGGW